jgi:hypothetical protein
MRTHSAVRLGPSRARSGHSEATAIVASDAAGGPVVKVRKRVTRRHQADAAECVAAIHPLKRNINWIPEAVSLIWSSNKTTTGTAPIGELLLSQI